MRGLIIGLLVIASFTAGWSQQIDSLKNLIEFEADTIAPLVASEELLYQDTLSIITSPPLYTDYEYVPADETPELLADRLSCIQQTIPLTYNDKIHSFVNYFTVKDREYTRMVLRRTDLYFPLIEKYLAKYNLPEELKYLAIVESGLNPRAVSRARAVGLWQFMPATGRYVGLSSNWYIDDRMDPEKSTEAACKYLTQLYSIFHDWQLALAAYNSGPGTVRKAIRRSGYKKSFWEIYAYLPRETRAYVPQFIAVMYALNYSEEHNMIETAKEQVILSDTLAVHKFLHFETFAKLTGTCLEDLQKLNPSVQRNAIPETGKTHIMRIPQHAKIMLDQNRVAILDSASRVGRTELETVAKAVTGSTYGREMIRYRISSGDVLGTIAERHHVRVDDIRKWNNLSGNTIRVGQSLNIWVPQTPKTLSQKALPVVTLQSDSGKQMYIVQPGDTLWDISKKFEGISIEKIKALNNLKTNKLQPGQKLILG
jgi:membrane-bound lytic murein transglycosylase D